MDRVTAADNTLGPPERVRGDGDAVLLVDGVDGRGRGHPGLDGPLEEETDDVAVAARDLLSDDHVQLRAAGRVLGRAQRAFDGVVVRDRDHVEADAMTRMLHKLDGSRPAVAGVRVGVEVSSTP